MKCVFVLWSVMCVCGCMCVGGNKLTLFKLGYCRYLNGLLSLDGLMCGCIFLHIVLMWISLSCVIIGWMFSTFRTFYEHLEYFRHLKRLSFCFQSADSFRFELTTMFFENNYWYQNTICTPNVNHVYNNNIYNNVVRPPTAGWHCHRWRYQTHYLCRCFKLDSLASYADAPTYPPMYLNT